MDIGSVWLGKAKARGLRSLRSLRSLEGVDNHYKKGKKKERWHYGSELRIKVLCSRTTEAVKRSIDLFVGNNKH